MSNLAVINNDQALTAVDIRTQVNLIQEVMKEVMKDGEHYGAIPGCGNKKALLKPGAEKLMATFRLCADPVVEDLSNDDCAKYRVTCRLVTRDGVFVGSGVGTCSTNEEKYKWRRTYIKEEFEDTPENKRRNKWAKYGNNPVQKQMQVRTEPADLDNTVLKMAKKRALIDAVLTATGASDIFVQDIEDLPEELKPVNNNTKPAAAKQTRPQTGSAPDELISKLKAAASQGEPALMEVWGKLSGDERNAVGRDFLTIKAEAKNAG